MKDIFKTVLPPLINQTGQAIREYLKDWRQEMKEKRKEKRKECK